MEESRKMPPWQKVHIVSLMAFFLGIVALGIGDQWTQLWPAITVPLGLTLSFAGGGIGIISGIVLLLTPGFKL